MNPKTWKKIAPWVAGAMVGLPLAGWAQTVTAEFPAYLPGEDIRIQFAGGPGNPKDWVGIYPSDIVPGTQGSTIWRYVDGTGAGNTGVREGTITFPGGLNLAGDWKAYLLLNDGYTILAEAPFGVVDPGTPLVRTERRSYQVGQSISVTFTNGPANPKDWIGIYQATQTPGAAGTTSTLWYYVDGTRNGTTGLGAGAVTFASGLAAAGDYKAYLLSNDGYDILAEQAFSVAAATVERPRLVTVSPADGATQQGPLTAFSASIANGTTQVATQSVVLTLNGNAVTPAVVQTGAVVSVRYTPTTLFPPGSTNAYVLQFADNGTPPTVQGTTNAFVVAPYRDVVLPAPLFFENFDAVAEGGLPAGWTGKSYTDITNPEEALDNLDSATFGRWTTVAASRFEGSFVTYSNPDNPEGWETDYRRVLSVNPLVVVNGTPLNAPLASGRFLFGNSGYRNGRSQYLEVQTPDYDLTGKTNVHVAFKGLWEQNQDSMAVLEYSVDGGTQWLPVAYYLDGPDIVRTTNEVSGEVTIDVEATLTTERGDVARYTNDEGFDVGGTYGSFVRAPISPALAPFIEQRINDDPVESKRYEVYPLPQAANQKTVRLRFAHAGTDSWYWGVDDFGLYSLSATQPPAELSISLTGSSVTITWDGAGQLQKAPTLSGPWENVPGASPQVIEAAGSAQVFRVLR